LDAKLIVAGRAFTTVKTRRTIALALLALGGLRGSGAEVACASVDSMAGLMDGWTRAFTATHTDTPARVTLRAKFSADAFDALLRGEVQVAPFSRELFPREHERYLAKFSGEPLLIPIATGSRDTKGGTHAIAIFINEKNPLARLSLGQLREIFSTGGKITTWGQVGLTGAWAARKISLHGMTARRETGNPPGVVNFLEHVLLAGRTWRTDLHEHVDVPGGPQALELIVRAVAADEAALGYSGFAYAQPGAKTLALAKDDGRFFAGTAEEVAHRDYPLARTIYLCLGNAPDAATLAFVRFVLSEACQSAIAADAEKFFPLPAIPLAAAQAQLTSASTPRS
jgi:phosphate transport system substrate-binding protein